MSAQSLPTTKEHARDHRRIGHRDTGRVTGFLGPNGAGKSATLRITVGLTGATSRTATISGRSHVDIPNPGLTCDYAPLHAPPAHQSTVVDVISCHDHATQAARAVSVCLRADAADAEAVILTTAPVTRNAASASAQLRAAWFHLPIVSAVEVNEVVGTLRERRVTILAADGAGPTDLDEAVDTGLPRPLRTGRRSSPHSIIECSQVAWLAGAARRGVSHKV